MGSGNGRVMQDKQTGGLSLLEGIDPEDGEIAYYQILKR